MPRFRYLKDDDDDDDDDDNHIHHRVSPFTAYVFKEHDEPNCSGV